MLFIVPFMFLDMLGSTGLQNELMKTKFACVQHIVSLEFGSVMLVFLLRLFIWSCFMSFADAHNWIVLGGVGWNVGV